MLFLAIFSMCVVAAVSLACAINYFLKPGPWKSLGYALFTVAIFLIFAASGLWQDAARHDWGTITPIFALMLVGGFICIKFGNKIWQLWQKNEKKYRDNDQTPF